MLQPALALLRQARERGRCLAALNIYNLESMQAAFAAARAEGTPLMLAFGESCLGHAGLGVIVAMARELAADFPQPAVLHLDHCKSLENLRAAVDAGFTSVMFDGSRLPLEDNIRATRKAADLAHARGISVEGELGGLNAEDGSDAALTASAFTDPEQAAAFVRKSGVDCLAVSVGNAHGVYRGTPRLDLPRLERIAAAVSVPLVLHGCSGLPEDQLSAAIRSGVAKINVNTDITLAAGRAVQALLADGAETPRFERIAAAARTAMEQAMRPWLRHWLA